MSETTTGSTLVFPMQEKSGNDAAIMGLLSAMSQKPNLDAASLMAMARDNGVCGSELILVLFLFMIFGGGYGGFGNRGALNAVNTDADTMRLTNFISNNDNFNRMMNAIQGSDADVRALAQSLNCSTSQVVNAINNVSSLIQGVGNQVGMTSQQVINAIQSGNAAVTSQLQSGFCGIGQKIQEQGYQSQLATCQQTNALTNSINNGVQAMKDSSDIRHHELMARLDNMEKSALQAKIDALQETKSTLQTQLSMEHQTQQLQAYQAQTMIPLQQALNVMQNELNAIKSAQPSTTTIPYSPVVGVPAAVAYQAGLTGTGVNGNGSFWY